MPTSPLGHRLMFMTFCVGAFLLFAPVVVLPIIKDHCELLAEEARLVVVNQQLEKQLARQEALVRAFKEDATVNERLAVLDLHYRNPSVETIDVLPPDFAYMPSERTDEPIYQSALKIPDTWPPRVREAERWAQQKGVIDLFMDASLRPVFLLMACGLLVAAFVLFAPRVQPDKARLVSASSAPAGGAANPSAA